MKCEEGNRIVEGVEDIGEQQHVERNKMQNYLNSMHRSQDILCCDFVTSQYCHRISHCKTPSCIHVTRTYTHDSVSFDHLQLFMHI